VTQYLYGDGTAVMAETSWSYGGGFNMSFCAIFERATLEMGYRSGELLLLQPGSDPAPVELPGAGGHEREIIYFVDCIENNRPPERCTPESTRETMRIAFAEEESALAGGKPVEL
jgi:predicted dehydrogenase